MFWEIVAICTILNAGLVIGIFALLVAILSVLADMRRENYCERYGRGPGRRRYVTEKPTDTKC